MSSNVKEINREESISFFLEAAPDAIVVVDYEGRIVMVNQLTVEMFGFKKEELLGQKIEILVPKRYRDVHVVHRTEYSSNPVARRMGEGRELTGLRKNGKEFPIEISLSPLKTQEGNFVISIIRDITGRKSLEAKVTGLLESAPDGIVVINSRGFITIVNGQAEMLFGYEKAELLGQPIEILVPERFREKHVSYRDGYIAHPKTRPMGAGRLLSGRKKDGTEFPVEISLSPLETEQGILITSIIRDITERRKADELIKASLREKEALLKEIHHRVKNNLQVTSSLLSLQSGYIQDERAKALFSESQNRIKSMALVHEKLYQKNDLSRINFLDYAESLVNLLVRSYGINRNKIKVSVTGEEIYFSIDSAIPCGLILNELVSNCFKHAFPGDRSGEVKVVITSTKEKKLCITIEDNGVGIPPGMDFEKLESLGLQLVRTLVNQINGTLNYEISRGTRFEITFFDEVAVR